MTKQQTAIAADQVSKLDCLANKLRKEALAINRKREKALRKACDPHTPEPHKTLLGVQVSILSAYERILEARIQAIETEMKAIHDKEMQQIAEHPTAQSCVWVLDRSIYKTECLKTVLKEDFHPEPQPRCNHCGRPIEIHTAWPDGYAESTVEPPNPSAFRWGRVITCEGRGLD